MMRRPTLFATTVLCGVLLSSCGVQGDLYRPTEPKPQIDRSEPNRPHHQQDPRRDEVMPDLI